MRRPLLFLALVVLLAVTGCDWLPGGFTDIGEIRRQPGVYDGEVVRVRGEVIDIVKLPILETRLYTLRDRTGEIMVFAAGNLPPQGETLAVKGEVLSAAIVGGEAFGVRLEEIKRLPGYLAR